MSKVYLGDAVYAELDGQGRVKLTTSDGLRDTNTVYLEPEVLHSLELWLDRVMPERREQ